MPPRTAKTGITVDSIKQTELYGVVDHAQGEALPLSDEAILQKLYAAEDFYEHDLALRFRPTRVLSTPLTRANHSDAALRVTDFDPILDIAEPAYDYPADHWSYERHGYLKLRHRPIREIQQVVFTWAGALKVWTVPREWIQWDAGAATLNVVPTSGAEFASMQFNAFLLRYLGNSAGLPHSIIVDYTTGFSADELEWQHQDLLNGVRLLTLLNLGGIVSNARSGGLGSSSLAIDGLSHSRGFAGKFGAYSGQIMLAIQEEARVRESWRASQRGIPMAIC